MDLYTELVEIKNLLDTKTPETFTDVERRLVDIVDDLMIFVE